jgi:hypothetical protein
VEPIDDPPTGPTAPSPDEALSTLRGAGAGIDGRLVGRVVAVLLTLTLVVLIVVFFVAGLHKNNQISSLRHHGVAVPFTVTSCLGLLGGSGSNAAGYACRGTYPLDGHSYAEPIPGDTLYRPGTTLKAVAVPGDPALVTTKALLAGEQTSAKVFILPAVLLLVLLLLVALVLGRRRARPKTG